jgi:hypothetical protein
MRQIQSLTAIVFCIVVVGSNVFCTNSQSNTPSNSQSNSQDVALAISDAYSRWATDTTLSLYWDTNKPADTYASLSGPWWDDEWVSFSFGPGGYVNWSLKTGLLEYRREELETSHLAILEHLIPGTKYTVTISSTDSTGDYQEQVIEAATVDKIAINKTIDNQRSGGIWVETARYNRAVVGGDGHQIVLLNNPEAVNPTWSQLVAFLENDPTDKQTYSSTFVCADFAEMLHNNAEKAGLRCAFVVPQLPGPSNLDMGIMAEGHALNAFRTTDRGLVFIDCVGAKAGESSPVNRDKVVDLAIWKEYVARALFPEPGWNQYYDSIGLVLDIMVFRW